jgi:ketosteroid isomerase-like protein
MSRDETGTGQASAALLEVDRHWSRQWVQAPQGASLDQIVSFWAPDALVLPSGQPARHGLEAIRKSIEQRLAAGGLGSSWQPDSALVASSGDLGITMGSNAFVRAPHAGEPEVVRGRYVAVWRKRAGGSWQCIVDIWNFSEP